MEIELDIGRKKDEPMLFNLAPLIDCVFLLLIFFLLTSSFVERGFFKVELPEARAASREDRSATVITLTRQGELFFNGKEATLENLKTLIVAIPERESESPILVEADREIQLKNLMGVMDILKECGKQEVSIETIVSGEGGSK